MGLQYRAESHNRELFTIDHFGQWKSILNTLISSKIGDIAGDMIVDATALCIRHA